MIDEGKLSIPTPKDLMRNEYDLSNGERGKFYGKVDTAYPLVIEDDETPCEISKDEIND